MTWLTRRKTILVVLAAVALLGIVGVGGGGWYYAGLIRDGALVVDHTPSEADLEVAAVEEGRVVLRATDKAKSDGHWTKDGIWGLEGEDGYARVGAILAIDDQRVVRELLTGIGTPEAGQTARLDSFAFTGDPLTALGLPFVEVSFTSSLGDFPAWFIDGPAETWAIFVHGRGANREEALRLLPTVVGQGYPSLVITYRNDEEAPASPSGFYDFGETEWQDLEGAAEYALDCGAQSLIVVGYSMGGAIVINFLYESPLAEHVRGVVLDAPVLSFDALIDYAARLQGIPRPLAVLGKRVAEFRFDIDWGNRDYLSRADELTDPILLFHGDADRTVSIETSEALAEARPDIVTYVRVAGATHVRSWNMDPEAYEEAVRTFLQRLEDR